MAAQPGAAPVILHVYDLSQGTARALSQPILGFAIDLVPHTGVEIYGEEIFFGGGIQRMPHNAVVRQFGLRPVQSPVLGHTRKTAAEIAQFLAQLQPRYTPATYDVFRNNCNHFSNVLVGFLLPPLDNGAPAGIPQDIVGLPDRVLRSPMGAMLGQMMSTMQQQMIPFNAAPQPAPVSIPQPRPTVVQALQQLDSLLPDHLAAYTALTTLNRILENIELHPLNPVFRTVPRANDALGKHTHAPLLALGFEDTGSALVLVPSADKWPRLQMGRKLVQTARKRRGKAWLQSLAPASVDDAFAKAPSLDRTDIFVQMMVRELFN